jgi:hypothetical protein
MKETSEERMAFRGIIIVTVLEILGILFLISINL